MSLTSKTSFIHITSHRTPLHSHNKTYEYTDALIQDMTSNILDSMCRLLGAALVLKKMAWLLWSGHSSAVLDDG